MIRRMFSFTFCTFMALSAAGCATENQPYAVASDSAVAIPTQPRIIEGQVVYIEGDSYVIRELSGQQTRVRYDRNTVRDNIAVGDMVVVRYAGPPASTVYASSITRGTGAPAPLVATSPVRFRTIEGTLLAQDANYYVIRDDTGREVRLHVDSTTKFDRNIRPGDRVVATVSSEAPPYASVYRIERPQVTQVESGGRQIILGEVVRTDGDWYTVRDLNGRDTPLQVDNTTRLNRSIREGDQVVAINAKPSNSPYESDVYSVYKRNVATTIQGEVVRTDVNGYIVRDVTGRDVRLQTDPRTLRNEDIRVGDRIIAYTGPPAVVHADSIERR